MFISRYIHRDGENRLTIVVINTHSNLYSPQTNLIVYVNEMVEVRADDITKYVVDRLITNCQKQIDKMKRQYMKVYRSLHGNDIKTNKKCLNDEMNVNPRFILLQRLIQDAILYRDSLILDLNNYSKETL